VGVSRSAGVLVLGGGLTGLSTALHLGEVPWTLCERDAEPGGKARSRRRDGYTFDVTGHWLHLRDERVRTLVRELFPAGDLASVSRRVGIWSHGTMLPYPFQANLHGLPREVVHECLVGFVAAREAAARGDGPPPRTFGDFCRARFGAGITRHFFLPYNRKLWGVDPDTLSAEWVSRYVPLPEVAQVVGGALGIVQERLGYNAEFLYPRAGGIDALPRALAARLAPERVHCGAPLEELDVSRRVARCGGQDWSFERVVSTLPLPELVRRTPAAPGFVREAAAALRSAAWRYLDVATSTPAPRPEHWIYVPEPDVPFFRVGIYSNAVPAMAPPGGASLYVELTDRTADPDLPSVMDHLVRMGAVTAASDVRFVEQHDVEHAYVLFDAAWESATKAILGWFEGVGVRSCGRYGAWVYNAMEDCIVAGMEAAAWARSR
jgi:protoporphyrinogen oxidase